MDSELYHEGSREIQDRFDTRRIADRLERVTLHQVYVPRLEHEPPIPESQ